MEQEGQLSAYRERLLDSLRDFPERRRRERPDSLRVFVNQECVGTLTCGGAGSQSVLTSRGRPVRAVEVRTATGLLVGGLSAETAGSRRVQFPVAGHRLEVSVENRSEGGSVRVVYSVATRAPQWVQTILTAGKRAIAGVGSLMPPVRGSRTPASSFALSTDSWRKVAVVGQAVLAMLVVLLVVDRLTDRWGLKETVARITTVTETSGRKLAAAEDALLRQEMVLARLARTQDGVARAVKAEKQQLARVRQAVDSLAQEQQELSASVETRVFAGLRDAAADLVRMREQIQSVTAATDALSKNVSVLETRAQVADIRQETQAHSFMFWVSFQDGTSEESIADLIREIHGRAGQIKAGWYNVEVSLPQPETPDSFVESLKKAKIVKAVTTKLSLKAE